MKTFFYLLLLAVTFFSGAWFGFQKADQTYVIRTVSEAPRTVTAVAVAPVKVVLDVTVGVLKGLKKIIMFPVDIAKEHNIKKVKK